MADIKWIKIDTGLFNNRKIRQIERMPKGDTFTIIWLKILILAAEVNDDGYLMFTPDIPYNAELLATQFDKPVETINAALNLFIQFNMLETTILEMDTVYYRVANWEKYQNIDGMERIREQNRLRKQRQRERERDIEDDSHVTERDSHGTDKDKEEDKDKNTIKKRTVFKPPTVDEVRAYCTERNNKIDPQAFIDFYESKGWMIGSNKMKDWKAAVRTWEKRYRENNNSPVKKTQQHNFSQNQYDFDKLEQQIMESQRKAEKRHKC